MKLSRDEPCLCPPPCDVDSSNIQGHEGQLRLLAFPAGDPIENFVFEGRALFEVVC